MITLTVFDKGIVSNYPIGTPWKELPKRSIVYCPNKMIADHRGHASHWLHVLNHNSCQRYHALPLKRIPKNVRMTALILQLPLPKD